MIHLEVRHTCIVRIGLVTELEDIDTTSLPFFRIPGSRRSGRSMLFNFCVYVSQAGMSCTMYQSITSHPTRSRSVDTMKLLHPWLDRAR